MRLVSLLCLLLTATTTCLHPARVLALRQGGRSVETLDLGSSSVVGDDARQHWVAFATTATGDAGGEEGPRFIAVNATVPGVVHTDLLSAGVIGDPYYRDNDVRLWWICNADWTYSRLFTLGEDFFPAASAARQILIAEGLDTVATVFINDKKVGSSTNMFVRYEFDVTGALQVGDNNITVKFVSAPKAANASAAAYPYVVPNFAVQSGVPNRNYLRKAQNSFSWDWGPAFPTQGIWLPIKLLSFSDAVLADATVTTALQSGSVPTNTSAFVVEVSVFLTTSGNNKPATITASVVGTSLSLIERVVLSARQMRVKLAGRVESPALW